MAPSQKKKMFRAQKGQDLTNWLYHRPLPQKRKKWLFLKKMKSAGEIGGMVKKTKFLFSFASALKSRETFPLGTASFSLKTSESFPAFEGSLSVPQRKNLSSQNFWFGETAAAIPGMSPLKKKKIFFSEKKAAYTRLASWLCFLKKKQIFHIFSLSQSALSKNWNALSFCESFVSRS